MSDAQLMQKIKTEWGAAIHAACTVSSVPEAFVAALIANESGGNPAAARFEAGVYDHLKARNPGKSEDWCRSNATSWGLTQIMGINYQGAPHELLIPDIALGWTLRMLARFAEQFGLDLTKDFEELLRCWNTGQPDKPTYDPNYVSNALMRMTLW